MVESKVDLEGVVGLEDVCDWTDDAHQRQLLKDYVEAGQAHLFASFVKGEDTDKKKSFVEELMLAHKACPGGVKEYIVRSLELLKKSKEGFNPFAGWKIEIPSGKFLKTESKEFEEAENIGVVAGRDCVFVLVAGGLGERLGYKGIKVELPTQTVTMRCYLQYYVEHMLELQRLSNLAAGGDKKNITFVIMTSGDTHAMTVSLLEKNGNFGFPAEHLHILKQEKVPALANNEAHIALKADDPYSIQTKPHGHGDVHSLIAGSGLVDKFKADGKKYIIFFQDTNAPSFVVNTAAIGYAVQNDLDANLVTVPRKAKEAVGAIARLVPADASDASKYPMTVNVEYNQLSPILESMGSSDENDASGFSPYPGNINHLIFSMRSYIPLLEETGGLVPEFVNPKYKDATMTSFKSPTRLECMMQDFLRLMKKEHRVSFTMFENLAYSPVKNNLADALKKVASGVPPHAAPSGEMDFYSATAHLLRVIGCSVEPSGTWTPAGLELELPARLVLSAHTNATFQSRRAHFPSPGKVSISAKSTLVLDGDVTVESLKLDGSLTITAAPGASVVVRDLTVVNAGSKFVDLDADADEPESLRIRGYKFVAGDMRTIEFTKPGRHVIGGPVPTPGASLMSIYLARGPIAAGIYA